LSISPTDLAIVDCLHYPERHDKALSEGSWADNGFLVAAQFKQPADGLGRKARRGKTTTVATYRDDPLYIHIERVVSDILATNKVVAPIDVLVGMNLLAPEKLEDWRRGRVPYLEIVINCNLTRLSRLLRIVRFLAHDLTSSHL
jgi:hypothetical protein